MGRATKGVKLMDWNSRAAFKIVFLAATLAACSGEKNEAESLAKAQSYLEQRNTAAAIIELKGALQSNANSGPARLLLGTALLAKGDAAGAEIELRRAQELQMPDEKVAPLLAQALLKTKQYAKLVTAFGNTQLSEPAATATVYTALAAAYAAQDDRAAASRAIDTALGAMPAFVGAQVMRARLSADAGDPDAALDILEGLLSRNPTSLEAWQLKAELLHRAKNDPGAAIGAYEQALTLEPTNAALHGALISLHFLRQDEAAARRQLEALRTALPEHPLTRLFDAQATLASGDYTRASAQFNELLAVLPDNVMLLYLAGAAELQSNALTQAEGHLLTALQLQPQFAAARRMLARVHLRARHPAKAVAVLKPLIQRPDADAPTLALAAQAQLLAGDTGAANATFTRAAKSPSADPKTRTALAIGRVAKGQADAGLGELQAIAADDKTGTSADLALISLRLQRKETDAALRAIDALERKQPSSPVAAELRGRAHLSRREVTAARTAFESALARDPKYMPAVQGLAALDLAENKPADARQRFEALLKQDPKNAAAHLALAELTRRAGGTPEQVGRDLASAVAADASDPRAHLALVEHHEAQGDGKAALSAAQAGVAALPASAELQDKLARVLMAAGDTHQAAAIFGRLATQNGTSPLGPMGLAEVNLLKKDFDAAARNARRALELDPNLLQAQRLAIFAAMGRQRVPEALAVARAIQTQQPAGALGYLLEGEIELSQSRWDAAITAFRKATAQPDPVQAPARLHFAMLQAKKTAEAAQFAEQWLARRPKDGLFVLYLADTASRVGDTALAEKRYGQLLAQFPDDAMALNNLAVLLLQQKKPGALALAERAVKAAPNRSALLDTLAAALVDAGQPARALEVQKSAVALSPGASNYRFKLAQLHLQAGDKAAARADLERLQKLPTPFPEKAQVDKLLKTLGPS